MTPAAWGAAWCAVASAATLLAFARDKAAAAAGGRRTPERTLHLLELLGGWPGALLAMALLRHKNRKASFVAVTVAVAALHAAGWAAALGLRP